MQDTNNKYEKSYSIIKTIIFDVIFLLMVAFICFYKFPYYVYTAGGSINLNERIDSKYDYSITGSYSMNYVTVMRGNLPVILMSFLKNDWDLVKEEEVTYSNTTYEETLNIEKIQLKNSLDIAKVVAYEKAGKPLKVKAIHSMVAFVSKEADTTLKALDEILKIDDKDYTNLEELKEYVNNFEEGHEFTFEVKDENGDIKTRIGKSYKAEDRLIIGISVVDNIEYEENDDITVKTKSSEAGPSGGLLLTLAMYDNLTPEDLSKGRRIMGTGTMDENGNVGEIGGVKYKMLGANKDQADIFFVPENNYEEAKEVYDLHDFKFKLVMVRTIDEAIDYLKNN